MKYDSRTKKCTCEAEVLTVEDVCDVCQGEYNCWCEEQVAKEMDEILKPLMKRNSSESIRKTGKKA